VGIIRLPRYQAWVLLAGETPGFRHLSRLTGPNRVPKRFSKSFSGIENHFIEIPQSGNITFRFFLCGDNPTTTKCSLVRFDSQTETCKYDVHS